MGNRVPKDAYVVNVLAVQKGTKYPNRYIIMSGDIDSRNSDTMDYTGDAPGANDNASGMAGTMEAARVLSKYTFENSIIYVAYLARNRVYTAVLVLPLTRKKKDGTL